MDLLQNGVRYRKGIRHAQPVGVRICPDGPLYDFSKMPIKKTEKGAILKLPVGMLLAEYVASS